MKRFLTISLLLAGVGLSLAEPDDAARTVDLYKRFTYTNVTSTEAREIFKSVHIHDTFNPRLKMQNPDPEWLPGWAALQLTDESQTAVIQAAINRTWTARVHADFKRYRDAWAAIDKQLRPELERASAIPGYYARGAALAKLLADARKAAEAQKVLYPAGYAPAYVGFVDDIITAMAELHHHARTEFMLDAYLDKVGVDRREVGGNGRAFAADDVERDLFTAFARKSATLDTPPLPVMAEYGKAFAAVKWPTSPARDAEIAKIRQQLVAERASSLGIPERHIPPLFDTSDAGDPADPKLRRVASPGGNYGPLVVTKVTGHAVELALAYHNSIPYNCKYTGRLDAQGDREQQCQYREIKTAHALAITFAELPAGVELKKGDEVTCYADLESKQETKTKVSYKLVGRALVSVARDGKPLAVSW